jgi:hypothetical protein
MDQQQTPQEINFDDLLPAAGKDISFDDLLPKKPDTTGLGTAARSAVETGITMPGVMAGAGLGARVGGAALGPWGALGGGIVGGVSAGILQSMGINSVEQLIDKEFGTNIMATKQAQHEEHPWAERGGSLVGMVAGPGASLANIPKMLTTKEGAKQAAVGAGAMAGIGGAQRAAMGEKVLDPTEIPSDLLTGLVSRPSKLGEKIYSKAAGTPLKAKPKDEGGDPTAPPKPPEEAPPEVKQQYLEKLKKEISKREKAAAEKAKTAKLVETAIRNKETGEIERMGPKHDEARKEETKDTHEQGFLDEHGNFVNRKEAWNRAVDTKQIPKDQKPTVPGEGLHSGDLRENNDPNFQITEKQPEGTPYDQKPFDPNELVTRGDHKNAIQRLWDEALWANSEAIQHDMDNKPDLAKELSDKAKALEDKADALFKNMPGVEFKNPEKPHWLELHDHLWNVHNYGEAIDKVISSGLGTRQQKTLLRVIKNIGVIREAGFSLSPDHLKTTKKDGSSQDNAGLYHPDLHAVELGKEGQLQVLLHEGIHAGTTKLLHAADSIAAQRLTALYEKYNTSHGWTEAYGFENVHEFVAEAFTSKKFQDILRSVKLEDRESKAGIATLWDEFKDTVRKGLGIGEKERTALDEVLDAGTSAIEEQEGRDKTARDAYKEKYSGGPLPSVVDLESKRKGIFEGDADTKKAWLQMGKHDFAQPINERFSTKSRDEAEREIHKKYLTKKDVLEAARLSKEDTDKHGKNPYYDAGKDYINKLLDERSDGKWLDEVRALKESKPKELERAKEEFGEMPDTRTKAEKARDTLAANTKRMETAAWTDKDIEGKAAQEASGVVAEAKYEASMEGEKLSDKDADKIHAREYERAYERFSKERERAKATVGKERDSLGSKAVDEEADKVDVRTIPNEKVFYEHAADIYQKHGEEAAIKFLEDYRTEVSKRSIPIPEDMKGMDDFFHKINTWATADESEMVVRMKDAIKDGVTKGDLEQWFNLRENLKVGDYGGNKEMEKWLKEGDEELTALVKKGRGMGLDIGEEFERGQSRIRIQGGTTSTWKKTLADFFANKTPYGEKIAEKADQAFERKVFGIEGTDRVVEIHRVQEDQLLRFKDKDGKWQRKDVKKGTEIWEWKDGKKERIGHSEDINFKAGDLFKPYDEKAGLLKMEQARVEDIEKHSPYRYLKDALATQSLARMGLRKMIREAEALEGLKKSELFKSIGHGPEEDLKTLPKGWIVPSSIDRVPQLRGWHFDPKAAAIVEDFAKNWDNNLMMKLTNQLVKNMMLNPLPHMFNEAMHLYNARGFTGWVNPAKWPRATAAAMKAWNDVGKQTEFYREVMRKGGSILGAEPRNNYFDELMTAAGKELKDPRMTSSIKALATKLGTTTLGLYNSVSRASQKAMWFTRDVMYLQYMHEIMGAHEKRTGEKMTTEAAIEKVERHMPNYRMSSEVLGSRGLAKVLKNPNISIFSRYHYGMVKSLVNSVKDIDPRNLKTEEGRRQFREGADTMLAIGFASAVLYPVMDKFAEMLFGEGAEQRRAGPYHLLKGASDVAQGKKDLSALLWPVFTLNPSLAILAQVLINKKIYSGKQIYHPNDTLGENVSDIASYMGTQVPQAPPIMSAVNDEGGEQSLIAKQMDIKVQTPAQKRAAERAIRKEEITRKSRETKRKKGEYKP